MIATVVYTTDFEPINVLELNTDILDTLENEGRCILKTPEGKECRLLYAAVPFPTIEGPVVKKILVTLDDETALMLQPGWLAGQRAAINFAIKTVRRLKNELTKYLGK